MFSAKSTAFVVLQILIIASNQLITSSIELTSDIGGSNDTVLLCPNELITLTCQTINSNALVWFYSLGSSLVYQSTDAINDTTIEPIPGGLIEFTLIDRVDNANYTSTAIVNSTNDLTISCSPDGQASDAEVMLMYRDVPSSPQNVIVVEEQIDSISLQWDPVVTADSYLITISPSPVAGPCINGSCSAVDTRITLDDLPLDTITFTITVTSVNCAGVSNESVMITQNTVSKAITEVGTDDGIIDDQTNIIVCPDESVNITCYTRGALLWLLSGEIVIAYVTSDMIGDTRNINGFNYTLIDIDGVDFTSIVEPPMNTSYNITCSPSGNAMDNDNSDIHISLLDVLSQPTNFVITNLCQSTVELEWDYDKEADDYYITVYPPPTSGICMHGPCINDYNCNSTTNKCSTIIDGLNAKEYTYTLKSINCAGMSQAATVTDMVTLQAPPVTHIVSLDEIDSDNDHISIFLRWMSPDINCQTPTIDNYTVIITAYGDPVYHTVNCCNNTFPLDRCGVYSFIVEPLNIVGTGPRSLPWATRRTGVFSLTTILSKTTDDSALIDIIVSSCLIPAVTNVTIMVSQQTALILQELSLSYPTTSLSVNQTIEELEAETEYNATVIVFYQESGAVERLTTALSFTTSEESLLTLQNVVIGSLTGFGFLGIVIIVLIIIIGILCLRDGYRKKQIRRLTRRQTQQRTQLRELEHIVHETQANSEAIAQAQRRTVAPPTVQYNQAAVTSPQERLYPELTNEHTYM